MMKGGVVILLCSLLLQSAFLSAESGTQPPSQPENGEPHNYIVYVSEPTTSRESPKDRCLRILSRVFPSKKAAEDAIVYVYNVLHGFAVTLTSHQATLLKAQAEVLNVERDVQYHLDLDEGKGIRRGGISTQPEVGE